MKFMPRTTGFAYQAIAARVNAPDIQTGLQKRIYDQGKVLPNSPDGLGLISQMDGGFRNCDSIAVVRGETRTLATNAVPKFKVLALEPAWQPQMLGT